jgi:hypothetical protein
MPKTEDFELPVPISEQSDYSKMSGFAAPRRIVGIARGSKAGAAYTVGNSCTMNDIAP